MLRVSAYSSRFCVLPATIFQVDPDAFDALTECIDKGDFALCEEVPAGNEDGFLVNPLGGITTNMAGAAG